MKHIIRTAAFTLILASALLSFEAQADRQGGGTLITAGRVSIDKWLDFDARLVPVVVPDLKIPEVAVKSASEFVRFKSVKAGQVTFDYTWISGSNATVGQVRLNELQISEAGNEIVKAILESKNLSKWVQLPAEEELGP